MIPLALAASWLVIVLIALCVWAALERASRIDPVRQRADHALPRRQWGGALDRPPGAYPAARALAAAARQVRVPTQVTDTSHTLRWTSRSLSLVAIVSALALLPFAGTWGASPLGRALVLVDLEFGLAILVFLLLLSALGQTAGGLAEGGVWARLGAARSAGSSLVGVSLLLLVLAPLALSAESLRLHDIVQLQRTTFFPLLKLGPQLSALGLEGAESLRLPGWFLLRQPLTAILLIPTLALLMRRSSVYDPIGAACGVSGAGIDSNPSDLYWGRLETRLAVILGAGLFVTLFMGAGAVPFVDPSGIVSRLSPLLGEAVPSLLVFLFEVGVFAAKLLVILWLVWLLRRSTASTRIDQSLQVATRRLLPLAWANLLLLSALSLLDGPLGQGLP